jgi:hypothetical protein
MNNTDHQQPRRRVSADPLPRRRVTGDAVATVVLFVVHLVLFGIGFFVVAMLGMITDDCGHRACGDPAWMKWALLLHICGGFSLVVADFLAARARLATDRIAFVVPAICCLLEIGLCAAAIALEAQSGPI